MSWIMKINQGNYAEEKRLEKIKKKIKKKLREIQINGEEEQYLMDEENVSKKNLKWQ